MLVDPQNAGKNAVEAVAKIGRSHSGCHESNLWWKIPFGVGVGIVTFAAGQPMENNLVGESEDFNI